MALVEMDDGSGINGSGLIDRYCGLDPLPAGTYYLEIDESSWTEIIPSYTLVYTLDFIVPWPSRKSPFMEGVTGPSYPTAI